MMATRLPAALCLLTIFLIAACAPRERSITLPDLSALAEPVQRQIRERFAALSQKQSNRATSTDLAEAYGELGRLLLAARLGTTAEASFLNAEVLMPRDRRWPYFLGHAYLLLGDRAKARAAFERTLSLSPNDLPATIWLAESHLDDGRPVEAEAVFLKAASLDPRSPAA
jgi:Flp pilus assembly protein TadD